MNCDRRQASSKIVRDEATNNTESNSWQFLPHLLVVDWPVINLTIIAHRDVYGLKAQNEKRGFNVIQ